MPPEVSFIIVNHNGGAMLRECLDSIERQTHSDREIIVVDNGSTDNSFDLPHFEKRGALLIRLDANKGFSEANNIAFAASKGRYVALINNDVTIASDWTERMLESLKADPTVGSVACRVVRNDDPAKLDSAGVNYVACGTVDAFSGVASDDPRIERRKPFGSVASASMYSREALEKAGLFHSRYFAYYEDTDLAVRLVLFGYGCAFAHGTVAYHRVSATGKRRSAFHTYQLRRNIELLYWVDMVGSLALRYAIPHFIYETLACLSAVRRGQFLDALQAKLDAVRSLGWILRERKELKEKLVKLEMFAAAKARLRSAMSPWWTAFAIRTTK